MADDVRPLRFGVVFTRFSRGPAWTDFARKVEDLGFSTLLVADHYFNPMACVPLMTAAASVTTTLRVGSYVLCNDFRSPAMLAKEMATLDVLSGGRVEVGIGAGWAKVEYDQIAMPFDPPGVRLARLEESVGVIRRLWAGEFVDHEGEFYEFHALYGSPRPVQKPLPLLIGGGGPRMIRFAARAADIVGFVPQSLRDGGLDPAGFTAESMDQRIAVLDDELLRSGRTDVPERSVMVFDTGTEADSATFAGLSDEARRESPHCLPPDPGEAAESIEARRERWGLTYHVCYDRDFDAFAKVVARLTR